MCSLEEDCSLKQLLLLMGYSKSQINKRLLKKEQNKKLRKHSEVELPIDLINTNLIYPGYKASDIEILFEDDDYLFLSKPSGVNGHSLSYSDVSCHSFLRMKNFKSVLEIQKDTHERGMLYRLDKVTSGVLGFAKTQKKYDQVRSEFSTNVKEKIYFALVRGDRQLDGDHSYFFKPSGAKGSKIIVSDGPEGHKGEMSILSSHYNKDQDTTLIKIKLITGLRHQIRAQLAYLGAPIIGDELYGGEVSTRVFLHAYLYKVGELEVKDESYSAIFSKDTSCT